MSLWDAVASRQIDEENTELAIKLAMAIHSPGEFFRGLELDGLEADTRTSEQIIADTLAAHGGETWH